MPKTFVVTPASRIQAIGQQVALSDHMEADPSVVIDCGSPALARLTVEVLSFGSELVAAEHLVQEMLEEAGR